MKLTRKNKRVVEPDEPTTSRRYSRMSNSDDNLNRDEIDEEKIPKTDSLTSQLSNEDKVKVKTNAVNLKPHKVRKRKRSVKRLDGRVHKQRRRQPKRRPGARVPKIKRPKYDISASTILSTRTSETSQSGCKYCGHRCCRR